MLLLDGSQMETVTIPYQPSLVPYCINKHLFPLDPPLPFIFVSPPSTFLHTLCQVGACKHSCLLCWTLPTTISAVKTAISIPFSSAVVLVSITIHISNSSPSTGVSFAATYWADKAPSLKQAPFIIMACTHDHHNGTSASPNSSEEIESHHGTPATKLSPFSPDQVPEEPKHVSQGIVRMRVPPPFVLDRDHSNFGPNGKSGNAIMPGSQDPFLSVPDQSSNTQSSGDGSKLSPNASTFTPTSLIESASSNGNSSSSGCQYPLSAPICGIGNQGSDFFSPKSRLSNIQPALGGTKCFLYSPNSSVGTPITSLGSIKLGQFSTDLSRSRSLMAGPVGRTTSAKEIEKLLGVSLVQYPNDLR